MIIFSDSLKIIDLINCERAPRLAHSLPPPLPTSQSTNQRNKKPTKKDSLGMSLEHWVRLVYERRL